MGDIGRFHFLGFIVSRVSYMKMWEVIQPAEEGKLEISYRSFRTCKDAEDCCMREVGRKEASLRTGPLILIAYRNLPLLENDIHVG